MEDLRPPGGGRKFDSRFLGFFEATKTPSASADRGGGRESNTPGLSITRCDLRSHVQRHCITCTRGPPKRDVAQCRFRTCDRGCRGRKQCISRTCDPRRHVLFRRRCRTCDRHCRGRNQCISRTCGPRRHDPVPHIVRTCDLRERARRVVRASRPGTLQAQKRSAEARPMP
jgi:hypothetical protein